MLYEYILLTETSTVIIFNNYYDEFENRVKQIYVSRWKLVKKEVLAFSKGLKHGTY